MSKIYFYGANGEVRFSDVDANCDGVIGNPDADVEFQAWISEGQLPQPAKQPDPNEAILAQISAIEQATMVPRITREGLLKFAEMAAETEAEKATAAGTPTTAAQLLSENIGYQKTKAVDDQIRALRSQLK